jgi:hypothetical protein
VQRRVWLWRTLHSVDSVVSPLQIALIQTEQLTGTQWKPITCWV